MPDIDRCRGPGDPPCRCTGKSEVRSDRDLVKADHIFFAGVEEEEPFGDCEEEIPDASRDSLEAADGAAPLSIPVGTRTYDVRRLSSKYV